ncbi:MAG: hypothetical protein E6J26_09085 [Chloroflexi bacterium]|nr:MAG: hypothetical protein E6J26_09085 [Chloroflexota bacterium]
MNAFACVVQTDIARTSACAGNVPGHGYPAVDFDIENGGESGDVVAAKDGVVVFRKDASNFGSPDPNNWTYANIVVIKSSSTEYAWYMHLHQASIPPGLQAGSTVLRGQKIGVEGTTGWSTGVHLHFNVATSYHCCLNPGDPLRIAPYWPGSDYTNQQRINFDEYAWTVLQQTDVGVSQNASPDCGTPSPNANQAILYDLRGYCGAYQVFDISSNPLPWSWNVPNDNASAIQVGSNITATVCVDGYFQGGCQTFFNNEPDLSTQPIGDNQISSVIVGVRVRPPASPTLLAPPNGSTPSEGPAVTLSWSVNADQSYGELDSPATGRVSFGWQNETQYAANGLPPGYTYSWHVKARNAGGESAWSEQRSFVVRPAAAANLSALAVSCHQVFLAWQARSSANVAYNVYRGVTLIAQTVENATAYQDITVAGNADVSYTLRATRNGIESDASNSASVHTPPCARLAYIYGSDTSSFNTLIASRGYAVDLLTPASAATFDFTPERTIVVGADATGWLPATLGALSASGKPIVGIGQGGAQLFAQLGLSLSNALPLTGTASGGRVVDSSNNVWWFPNLLPATSGVITLYNSNVPFVAMLNTAGAGGVVPIAQLPDNGTFAPFIAQQVGGQCYLLWGWGGPPAALTATGQLVFMNSLLTYPCTSRQQSFLPVVAH